MDCRQKGKASYSNIEKLYNSIVPEDMTLIRIHDPQLILP